MRLLISMSIGSLLIFSSACSRESQPPLPPSPAVGQIVRIDGDRMEIEFPEGARAHFVIGDDSVPREHLVEHMQKRWPVQVTFERRGDSLTATRIVDAATSG
jgi:hypothetical protein